MLVIGGGPSGLAAALEAAAAGARVALVDEAFRLGGSGADRRRIRVAARADRRRQRSPRITVFGATVAAGYYADHWVALAEPTRMTKMRAKAVVFATGVIEQPAVFRNNDLPGVMLASGAWRLLRRYRVAPGRRVVMVAANLEAYSICLDLHAQGVQVAAIVDLRAAPTSDSEAARACAEAGMTIIAGLGAVRGHRGRRRRSGGARDRAARCLGRRRCRRSRGASTATPS